MSNSRAFYPHTQPEWSKVEVGDTVTTRGRHGAGQPLVVGVVVAIDGQHVKIRPLAGRKPVTRTIRNVRRIA